MGLCFYKLNLPPETHTKCNFAGAGKIVNFFSQLILFQKTNYLQTKIIPKGSLRLNQKTMKLFFTLASFALIFSASTATVRTVTCQNGASHFLPITVNAVCGDTICWTWVSGTHVVGPISASAIPSGAAMWNAPINASNLSSKYVVTVPGNYHYVCHPANPHGEDAYIVVTCANGVQQYNLMNHFSSAYPNPFTEKITIDTSNADLILIYNFMGEKISSFPFKSGQTKLEADLATLPKGIFFYSIIKDGAVLETRKIIKGW